VSEDVKFANKMQEMQFNGLAEFIKQHNDLVAKINAATGDRDYLFESIANEPEFAELTAKIAELQEQLETAVNERVEGALANATGDIAGLQDEVKELKSTISSGTTYYKKLYKDESAEKLPKVDRVKGTRVGTSGGRRVRGYNVIVTVGSQVDEYDNFASAAKALGVETTALQEQFFAKAGVEKLKDAPEEVSFGMSWTDTDENGAETNVTATVKAYRTGPSGPPTAETDDDGQDAEDDEDLTVDEDELENV
jgi:hypothetical protein